MAMQQPTTLTTRWRSRRAIRGLNRLIEDWRMSHNCSCLWARVRPHESSKAAGGNKFVAGPTSAAEGFAGQRRRSPTDGNTHYQLRTSLLTSLVRSKARRPQRPPTSKHNVIFHALREPCWAQHNLVVAAEVREAMVVFCSSVRGVPVIAAPGLARA